MSTVREIDVAWRDEWATALAAPSAADARRGAAAATSLLEFRLGGESWALPVGAVGAAAATAAIAPLPGRRDRVVHGLFHLDGQLLLAADLRRLLRPATAGSTPNDRARFPRVLLLGHGAESFAAPVDDVPGTFALPESELAPLPLTAAPDIAALARGTCRRGGGVVVVLDDVKLLSALAADLR